MKLSAEDIAGVCHEANRGLQLALLDQMASPPWDKASDEIRASAIEGVETARNRGGVTPEQSHEGWCRFKRAHGWVYGEVKDEAAKRHPCLVPYEELPEGQRLKDRLFLAIVAALS